MAIHKVQKSIRNVGFPTFLCCLLPTFLFYPLHSILIAPKNNSDIAEKGVKHFLRYHKIKAKVEKSEMPLRY